MDSQNKSNPSNDSRGGFRRRRPYRGSGSARQDSNRSRNENSDGRSSAENKNRFYQSSSRSHKGRSGKTLTSNQVLVKYDNLLEQHLVTRKKYFEYFNRVDERQLKKLEKNFFDSIEHLRRFEESLESWQREALEKRKTERYKLDLTYSQNRGWIPEEMTKIEVAPTEIEDPHFKESQKFAFEEYKDDTEESVGSIDDYLKLKGQA